MKQEYEAALAAGDLEKAETILRGALAEAHDPHLLALLGNVLRKRGKLDEAEALLAPAAEATPTYDLLDRLSAIQYQRQNFAGAERSLERLIQLPSVKAPIASYRLLAKLKATAGDRDGAREVMARGVSVWPGVTDFIAAYADLLPREAAIRALEDHLEEIRYDPARLAYVLQRITEHRAVLRREAAHLPAFGLSWPDTYQWPDAEALPRLRAALVNEVARGAKRASARIDLACVAAAEGDWEGAEEQLQVLRGGAKRSLADFTAFGSAFHGILDSIDEEDLHSDLARVERLLACERSAGVGIFIGCDPKYFDRFTLPFLRQVEAEAIPLDVHVHILDGDAPEWAPIRESVAQLAHVRATLTAEVSGALARGVSYARQYYHAVRFVRFYQELKRSQRPTFLLDADVQLLRDPRAFLDSLCDFDLALRTNAVEFYPNLKITATCVGVSPTPRGLEFARRVAAYIVHWKNRGTWDWSVDQLGLLSAYAHMVNGGRQPATLFLDDNAINDKFGESGVFKFLSGIDKYGRIGRAAPA